jgi:hypothetical protein
VGQSSRLGRPGIGRIHGAETADRDRDLGVVRLQNLRHTFGYRFSEASGYYRAELERRFGHTDDRNLRLCTNPPNACTGR